jgi:multiple sugar transport system substrate-binding protein
MKMNKILLFALVLILVFVSVACGNNDNTEPDVTNGTNVPNESNSSNENAADELKGEIVMWHSFTQGPRLEYIQRAADEFMAEHSGVTINIETFAWSEFYTKWTTGLLSGQVPDVSTALPNHVVELIDVDALIPLNDVIDNIGRERFYEAPLLEGTVDGNNYSIPMYSHAQVMWYRQDLLEAAGLNVPQTWDELYEAAVALTKAPDVYGMPFPTGLGDMMGTRYLNFYVRSAGETLITEDGKANLTSPAAIEGINYWTKMYKAASPEGSITFGVLDQATLFYQGNSAFDFNSGFHIGGVASNSPQLLEHIAAAPVPKMNANDERNGIETSNIPVVAWKNSKHPEIVKAFIEKLYETDGYIEFLHSVPAGMLPALKDISEHPDFLANETIKQFQDSVQVISDAVDIGTAIGMEFGPSIESGLIASQGIIEQMFHDILLQGVPVEKAAQTAEDELNRIFATY